MTLQVDEETVESLKDDDTVASFETALSQEFPKVKFALQHAAGCVRLTGCECELAVPNPVLSCSRASFTPASFPLSMTEANVCTTVAWSKIISMF